MLLLFFEFVRSLLAIRSLSFDLWELPFSDRSDSWSRSFVILFFLLFATFFRSYSRVARFWVPGFLDTFRFRVAFILVFVPDPDRLDRL